MKKLFDHTVFLYLDFIFVIAIMMNFMTPMSVADDGAYTFIKESVGHEFDDNRPVANLSDIVESMTNHWYTHNGRIVNHSLESLFMGIVGKPFSMLQL